MDDSADRRAEPDAAELCADLGAKLSRLVLRGCPECGHCDRTEVAIGGPGLVVLCRRCDRMITGGLAVRPQLRQFIRRVLASDEVSQGPETWIVADPEGAETRQANT